MSDDELLERMRANPRSDWTIADIERLCRRLGLIATAPRRGSHYKIRDPNSGATLTIPARRPIKPVYIRALVTLTDRHRASGEKK
jgi:predicted RNA binding protein YcfA (HicA-like mRNA interferase family)